MAEIKDLRMTKGIWTITYNRQSARSNDLAISNEAVDRLYTEGGEGFYNYVNSLGLSKDSDLIVLSSLHHYYYDSEEMNSAKTVVNLKELNQVKQLKDLLHSHLHFLSQKCNFVGRFVNNKKIERYAVRNDLTSSEDLNNSDEVELGILSRFPFINMIYSLMDSKTNTYLSEKSVALMLGIHGFKIMDMTEYKGVTFFHS